MTRSCIGAFLILFTIVGATGESRRVEAQAPAASNPTFDAELRELAALPGEPRAISAAGVRHDESPVATLENVGAFDTPSTVRRLAIVGAPGADANARAALAAVRWFKTSAPRALRTRWLVSVLPSADFDAADTQSLARWITFQAPDLVVTIGGAAAHADAASVSLDATDVLPALQKRLEAPSERSALRATIDARVAREPLALARRLAKRYPETPAISYIPSVAWTQTLRLAGIVHDDSLREKVIAQTRPWIAGEKTLFGDRVQLTAVAGTMIFADLAASGDAAAGALATKGADLAAEENPGSIAKYGQGWTDDMFMGTSILARTGARADRPKDFDVAADRLLAYASRLQRADGLFNHASDAPVTWGRGNGFAALGLVEALTRLPPAHPARAKLLEIYRRQMAAALAQQAPDGMWREIVDAPGAYREESATAMLMTAMARGVRLGWLDRSYRSAIDRAWRGLAAHVTEDGGIIDICTNTGAGPTRRYYFDRAAVTGADDRGGAMALLGSLEVYELRVAR